MGLAATIRLYARAAALLLLFAIIAPLHIVTKALTGSGFWTQRFLAWSAWIAGLRIETVGSPITRHSLIVANHVSWLDILAIGGTTNAAFVSKDNLGHGLVHWLADQQRTIYVKRENRRDSRAQAEAIARALGNGPVALFPEGTTGPGGTLLPFRSTLLDAANGAVMTVDVRPVAIDYGAEAKAIAWNNEPAILNVRRILGRRGTLPVTIRQLDPLPNDGDRKLLAQRARTAIAEALGFPLDEPSPIGAAT